jgi:predicted nuclease with TOPRIM domain
MEKRNNKVSSKLLQAIKLLGNKEAGESLITLQDTTVPKEKSDLWRRIKDVKRGKDKLQESIKIEKENIRNSHSPKQKELLNNKLKQIKRSKNQLNNEFELIKDKLLDMCKDVKSK